LMPWQRYAEDRRRAVVAKLGVLMGSLAGARRPPTCGGLHDDR
jgi:hypothetical protein